MVSELRDYSFEEFYTLRVVRQTVCASKRYPAPEHLGRMRTQHGTYKAVERLELRLKAKAFCDLTRVIAQCVGRASATKCDQLLKSFLDFSA
jgi:hypothetical protein